MNEQAAVFNALNAEISDRNARLVAVSKTQSVEKIQALFDLGQRVFGENRVQELLAKQPLLPVEIEWHLIGHLQSNKVKFIAPIVSLIQSVDSFKLLQEVDNQAVRCGRVIDCLLQFHVAEEETKFGFSEKAAREMLTNPEFSSLQNVRICGIMGMATFTENQSQVRLEFRRLRQIFEQTKADFFSDNPSFRELSMGMSGDYKIALEEGATMVRIGGLLFK